MITLSFSPCPNDTFIFFAIVHDRIDLEGLSFTWETDDVETLNHRAFAGNCDMIKVSYHAYLTLREKYELLNAGSALGFGNGPLLISRNYRSSEELYDRRVAIPGEYTTAHLLLKFAAPQITRKEVMLFSEIEDAITEGRVDAGVIIHENRFTYENKGLHKIMDLGEFWEKQTGMPVPLGGIVVKKELGADVIAKLNRIMKRSVEYAFEHPDETMDFVRSHAREMDDAVMRKHIGLYVTAFTVDLGKQGRDAIQKMIEWNDRLTSG